MAVTGLLQFTPGFGICWNQKSCKEVKYPFRRGQLHLPATNLSSLSLGQDLLTRHLSESIKRPICPIPLKYNSLSCRSSLLSDPHITSSCLKTVATALTRSYNSLQGSPSIIKLITSVGVVVFTLWGLGPLVRSSRNLFLHKNDNSWKKSTTHYVLTSYIQPILLWTGAMLVCSALDPMLMPTEASRVVKERVIIFVRSLATVVSFAYCLSCAIHQAQKFFMQSDPSDTRNMGFQFAAKAVYSAVWVAAVSLFMELLGFSTQKWLTAGGLGTVLLTLAGREIFTNFLSSAMIHATRPFVLNEWIQTKIEGYEVSGTVEHVGWWSPTIIRGEDREAIHIPNHKFTMNVVRNLSQKTHWRIKTHLAISHLDVNKINNIVADMRKVLAKNPQVEQQKLHRRVFLDYINPENQALTILISCFVKTSHHEEYYCVKDDILLDLLRVISHHRARLATPIRTIQKVYTDADVEGVPFSEAFSRSRAASNRPFLLIEPSYKINGEERAKPRTRSGGDQDSRSTGQSTSDPKMDAKIQGKSASESKSTETKKSSTKIETTLKGDAEDDKMDAKIQGKSASESKSTETKKSSTKIETTLKGDAEDDKQSAKSSTLTSTSDKDSKVDESAVKPSTTTNLDKKPDPKGTQLSGKADSGVSSESGDKKPSVPSSASPQSKQGEKASTTPSAKPSPALEENIVLGVALEGSKRTLPIDDDHGSPLLAEAKEAAATTQNSTPALEKDEKDK